MNDTNLLKKNGFQGFKTIAELRKKKSIIPKQQGVYVVLYGKDTKPTFVERGTGGFFKGKDPNVSIEELEQKWVENTSVIYIGKAGGSKKVEKEGEITSVKLNATLNSRLSQYLGFGNGKKVGHWGGRYTWQLADAEDLIICWKITDEEPRTVEQKMIADFKNVHSGERPFANKAD